jgi:hypothetical protein
VWVDGGSLGLYDLTLTCYLDSVCPCGNADGLAVVEVLQHLDSRAWVGTVFEVGHFVFLFFSRSLFSGGWDGGDCWFGV